MIRLVVMGWALTLAGCLLGGGPTLGIRTTGQASVGWEVTTNLAAVGAELGQSYALDTGRSVTFGAARAFVALRPAYSKAEGVLDDRDEYFGGALGIARGDGGLAPYAAAWPMYMAGTRDCGNRDGNSHALFTVQLGLRFVAGAGELYVAPKLNYFEPLCFR